jgi:hypothetical protein
MPMNGSPVVLHVVGDLIVSIDSTHEFMQD